MKTEVRKGVQIFYSVFTKKLLKCKLVRLLLQPEFTVFQLYEKVSDNSLLLHISSLNNFIHIEDFSRKIILVSLDVTTSIEKLKFKNKQLFKPIK